MEHHYSSVSDARGMRVIRALRLLRVSRMLRLAKMKGVLSDIFGVVTSEFARTGIRVLTLLAFVISVNHFVACGWYWICTYDVFNVKLTREVSWVHVYGSSYDWQLSYLYLYATALHWSLTLFTPASMEVVPRDLAERVYCVLVLLFAMVTFSTFISSITQAMTSLRNFREQDTRARAEVRQYFRRNDVSPGCRCAFGVTLTGKHGSTSVLRSVMTRCGFFESSLTFWAWN